MEFRPMRHEIITKAAERGEPTDPASYRHMLNDLNAKGAAKAAGAIEAAMQSQMKGRRA